VISVDIVHWIVEHVDLTYNVGRAWWREPVDPRSPFAAGYSDDVTPGQARAVAIDFALGAAQHDMYHAAQIFVLRRGYKTRHV
jgi:hypothetical protein